MNTKNPSNRCNTTCSPVDILPTNGLTIPSRTQDCSWGYLSLALFRPLPLLLPGRTWRWSNLIRWPNQSLFLPFLSSPPLDHSHGRPALLCPCGFSIDFKVHRQKLSFQVNTQKVHLNVPYSHPPPRTYLYSSLVQHRQLSTCPDILASSLWIVWIYRQNRTTTQSVRANSKTFLIPTCRTGWLAKRKDDDEDVVQGE